MDFRPERELCYGLRKALGVDNGPAVQSFKKTKILFLEEYLNL